MKTITLFAAFATLPFAAPAQAQDAPEAIVSIYHVAPGQHVNFLKWAAQQDAISTAAGVPASQLYVHTDGDSWDYILINPVTTPEQDAAVAAAAKAAGVEVMKGGLAMRQYITSHTDTYTVGPISAAGYLKAVGE